MRRRGSSSAGKNAPSPSLGMPSSTSPALVDSNRERVPLRWRWGCRWARTGQRRCAGWPRCRSGPAAPGQTLADDVQGTASTQPIQQISNGRLVQGHRGVLLGVNLGRITPSFTRWPLALLLSKPRTSPQSPPLPRTPTSGLVAEDPERRRRPRPGIVSAGPSKDDDLGGAAMAWSAEVGRPHALAGTSVPRWPVLTPAA
jgi:hypothetical protein